MSAGGGGDPRLASPDVAGDIGAFARAGADPGTDREQRAAAARQLLLSTLQLVRGPIGAEDPPLVPLLDGLARALNSVGGGTRP